MNELCERDFGSFYDSSEPCGRSRANEYRFVTRWRVEALREEVFAVLTDAESLTRWWPSVYRSVQPIAPPNGPDGVGKRLLLDTQGWLPYRHPARAAPK